jgi:hypothetical protein
VHVVASYQQFLPDWPAVLLPLRDGLFFAVSVGRLQRSSGCLQVTPSHLQRVHSLHEIVSLPSQLETIHDTAHRNERIEIDAELMIRSIRLLAFLERSMSDEAAHSKCGRRDFLGGLGAIAGAISLSTPSVAADSKVHAAPLAKLEDVKSVPWPEAGYLSFGPDEAGFVEALVNVMCPADDLTPNGVDCGLAVYF